MATRRPPKATSPMPPHVRRAFDRWSRTFTNKGLDIASAQLGWLAGFFEGKRQQHENITRVLCTDCMDGSPLSLDGGIPIHTIQRPNGGGPWRRTCAASMIAALAPHPERPT